MFQNILVVCLDDIRHSPTAEWLPQRKLPQHQISSAGLKTLIGNDADSQTIKAALKHGVIVAGHTTRQLTTEMYEKADLILVMGPEQIDVVADIHPPARSKTTLSARWLPKKTMPDLSNQSNEMFEAAYLQPEEAAQAWTKKLNAGARDRSKPRNIVRPTNFMESLTP